jgi:hypothetical protein
MAGRGPDWLLGFGFTVKDKHLLTFLDQAESKFDSLAKTIKKLNKGSSGKSGGLDMSQFTEAVKPRGRGSLTSGLTNLDKSVSSIVKHVTTGLQHVNDTGRDISISLHRSILTLLDDVDAGAFKASKNLEELPAALMQIPGLSKDAESSLTKLFDELEAGKATHDDLVKTFKGLRKEIKKTVEDSSGVELLDDKLEKLHDTAVDLFDILRPSSTDEIFKKAGEGLGKLLGALTQPADQKELVDKKTFDEKQLEKFKAAVDQVANSMRSMGDIDPTQMRNVKRMTTDFSKRMATPATKLGKMFSRVPLINRLFGKKPDLKFIRQELGKVVKETQDWSDFDQFKDEKEQPGLPFQDFLEIKKTDVDKALGDAEITLGDAISKMQKELSAKGMPAWESIYEPGPHEAAAQASKIEDWAEQAFDPKMLEKAMKYASGGTKLDPLSDIFDPANLQTPEVVDATEKVISDLWAKLKDGTPIESAVAGLSKLKVSFEDVVAHGISPFKENLDNALLSAKSQITDFGDYFYDWVHGQFSYSLDHFRERITRSAKSFDKLTDRSDIAFNNILLAQESFLLTFQGRFDKISEKVGNSVGKISIVTEHELRQMESGQRDFYSNMEEISRRGVEQQAAGVSRGYDAMEQGLRKTKQSTVDSILERADALHKLQQDIPSLTKMAAVLTNVESAAARMGSTPMEPVVSGAEGASESAQRRAQPMEASHERLAGGISERIGQMSAQGGAAQAPTVTVERPETGDMSAAVVRAVDALGTKLLGQFGKLISTISKIPAQQAATGELKVKNDEMKKSIEASTKTKRGLRGGAR